MQQMVALIAGRMIKPDPIIKTSSYHLVIKKKAEMNKENDRKME